MGSNYHILIMTCAFFMLARLFGQPLLVRVEWGVGSGVRIIVLGKPCLVLPSLKTWLRYIELFGYTISQTDCKEEGIDL